MARKLSPRFGMEVTVLAIVTALLILLEVERPTALAVIFAVWLGIATFELIAPRRRAEPADDRPARSEEEPADRAAMPPLAGAEPFAPEPSRAAAPRPAPAQQAERPEGAYPLAVAPFDEAAADAVPPRRALAAAPTPRRDDAGRRDAEEDAETEEGAER